MTREALSSLRDRLMLSGTLAAFAMTAVPADAAVTPETDKDARGPKPVDAGTVEQQARPSQTVHTFDIAPGTLAEVAAGLENATGMKITVPERYKALPSPGVRGVLTSEEAFTKALAGTDISADFASPERVVLALHAANQDVTVTAQSELVSPKYTAPLRDLPMTLTVIPESVIENTASTSLVEALRTVSGITFGAGEGGNPVGDRPFIRGVDSQASTFVDGLRDIGSQSREVFDLDSVEVSKGPSSTYAGRGTSGGSLNLNSKMARQQNFLAGSFSPGTANFFRGTVDGESVLSTWGAARLNGLWQDADIPGRDIARGSRYGLAPAFYFKLANRVRINTNYYHLNSHDVPDVGIPYNNPVFNARVDGRQRIYQTGDGQPLLINRNLYYGINSRDFRYEKAKAAFGRAEVDVSEGITLRNSYRYGKTNQDYAYSQPDDSQGNIYYGLLYRRVNPRISTVDSSINQTDLAGTFKTASIKHTFATGAEFSRERTWNNSYTFTVPTFTVFNTARQAVSITGNRCPYGAGAAGGYLCTDLFNPTPDDPFLNVTYRLSVTNPASVYTNTLLKTTTVVRQITGTRSVYGFDTLELLPQLQVTVGVRYDHYSSGYRNALTCVPTAAVPCTFSSLNDLVNYIGAVNYKPRKAISIYGSVNSSATPPGNALTQGSDASALTSIANQALPPEKTRSEEGGVKWELFGGKALATAAYFRANTQNVRITQADGSIQAVGERQNQGVDLSLTGYVTRKLQVFGGYTYMNAILQHTGVSNAIINNVSTPVNGLLDGRRFPNTPENSFSVTSYYLATRKLNVGGGVYGVGKVFGNDNPTAPKWVQGYVRVDLYGSYRFNPHVELQGNMQNLTDKVYFSQAYTTHYASLAPGRQGRLALNVRF